MCTNNPAGSQWGKWDLHVHTPESIVHNYDGAKEEAWEKFINDLEALPPEFKAIGINDYVFIDGYERVLKEKKAGRLNNIDLILPVIEFRLDKFAGTVKKGPDGKYSQSDWNRINLHIIFAPLEPEVIRQQFLSGLVQSYQLIPDAEHLKGKWKALITRDTMIELGEMIIDAAPSDKKGAYASPLQEGFNNLCFNFGEILKALDVHHLKDRYLTAVGKTEWDNMKWDDHSIAEKRNVINRADIVFTAAETPAAYASARKKLTESGINDVLLDCSDAHTFSQSPNKDRIGNAFTWVKADPTFEGLRHAIAEFDQRIFVGDAPPKLSIVANNRTKYLKAIEVRKVESAWVADTWFDVNVPLNQDLVAIIGNKGSGKSALADITALVGNTRNHHAFSFLTQHRFRDRRNKLAQKFVGTLHWEDGTSTRMELHEDPTTSSVERVKYLPQSYLESLCNELAAGGASSFDAELRNIIYSHVPQEGQLGFATLDELLAYKGSEVQGEIERVRRKLSKTNSEIVAVEKRLTKAFHTSLEEKLTAKQHQLEVLDKVQLPPVEDPKSSDAVKEEIDAARARLTVLGTIIKKVNDQEATARLARTEALRRAAQVAKILQAVGNHKRVHDQALADLEKMISEVSDTIKAADVLLLSVKTETLDALAIKFQAEAERQGTILSNSTEDGIPAKRLKAQKEIDSITAKLGEKHRIFIAYKAQVAQRETQKTELIGDETKANSIKWLEKEIRVLDALPAKRDRLKAERVAAVRGMHKQLGQLVSEYREMYEPVQAFVDKALTMEMPLPLSVNVLIAEEGFHDGFLGRINRQARGSFAGIDESAVAVRALLQEVNFSDEEAVISFIESIDGMLHFDRRAGVDALEELEVGAQLRKGFSADDLYDFVFGLSYLIPKYSLNYNGREISQLSPGERGLLLLVFYLLVDKDDIPLVIDQPEENLDNQTIYKVLVQCIKEAKKRRQVIMVTHNPNLAVVCDAEQIIYAKKTENTFSYETGAIESPEIKHHVVEILEGTKPAFDNRRKKYGFRLE